MRLHPLEDVVQRFDRFQDMRTLVEHRLALFERVEERAKETLI
jgi:hypothetical protein